MKSRSNRSKKKQDDEKKVDTFVSGAEYQEEIKKSPYSWKDSDFKADKVRKLTVRIPEEYALKLDYLSKNSVPKTTKQRFILENLIAQIDKELKKKGIS